MRKKIPFTLFEVMVGIALLAIAAGAMGWRMHRMIQVRRFAADVEKLRARVHTCHRLALNMQADWKGVLTQAQPGWTFTTWSPDSPAAIPLTPLSLQSFGVSFNGEKTSQIIFDFTATGEVFPQGVLTFSADGGVMRPIVWTLPEIFLLEEGKKGGPAHPDDPH